MTAGPETPSNPVRSCHLSTRPIRPPVGSSTPSAPSTCLPVRHPAPAPPTCPPSRPNPAHLSANLTARTPPARAPPARSPTRPSPPICPRALQPAEPRPGRSPTRRPNLMLAFPSEPCPGTRPPAQASPRHPAAHIPAPATPARHHLHPAATNRPPEPSMSSPAPVPLIQAAPEPHHPSSTCDSPAKSVAAQIRFAAVA